MKAEHVIEQARQGFETSFAERSFYEKQTADETHLNLLLRQVAQAPGDTLVDLGTGTGFLAFPIARKFPHTTVVGLDIVAETLKQNTKKAQDQQQNNLSFLVYDGGRFPFLDRSVNTLITRYALHHFPDLQQSFQEIFRVLKPGGRLILSDPTPNANDTCSFADRFMQMKPDGHIRFCRLEGYTAMLEPLGFRLLSNLASTIRFPRKNANLYAQLIEETDSKILTGYDLTVHGDEIWITEQVLNLTFLKEPAVDCVPIPISESL